MPVEKLVKRQVNVKDLVEPELSISNPIFDLNRDVSPEIQNAIRNELHGRRLVSREDDKANWRTLSLFSAGVFTGFLMLSLSDTEKVARTIRENKFFTEQDMLKALLLLKISDPQIYKISRDNNIDKIEKARSRARVELNYDLEKLATLKLLGFPVELDIEKISESNWFYTEKLGLLSILNDESRGHDDFMRALSEVFSLKIISDRLFKQVAAGIDFQKVKEKAFPKDIFTPDAVKSIMYFMFISADEIVITDEKIELVNFKKKASSTNSNPPPLPERRAF